MNGLFGPHPHSKISHHCWVRKRQLRPQLVGWCAATCGRLPQHRRAVGVPKVTPGSAQAAWGWQQESLLKRAEHAYGLNTEPLSKTARPSTTALLCGWREAASCVLEMTSFGWHTHRNVHIDNSQPSISVGFLPQIQPTKKVLGKNWCLHWTHLTIYFLLLSFKHHNITNTWHLWCIGHR